MWWKQNQHPRSWRQASSGGWVSAGICKSYISPYLLRIPEALTVISLEDLPLMTRGSAGIAVCVLFVFPCNSLAESFWQWHSGWSVQAGKCKVRASLQEDRALQQGQHFNQCPTAPEAGGKRPSLEYSQYQWTCYTSRKDFYPSNSGDKRRQVCISQTPINVPASPAALLEKSIILSFHVLTTASGLAQGWLQCCFSRVSHSPQWMSCHVGRSPVLLLWMGCARPSSSLPAWNPSWSLPGPPRCSCSAPEDGRE